MFFKTYFPSKFKRKRNLNIFSNKHAGPVGSNKVHVNNIQGTKEENMITPVWFKLVIESRSAN